MYGVQPGPLNLRRFYALAERNHKRIDAILTPRQDGSMPTEFEAMAALFCTSLAKFSPDFLDCLKQPDVSEEMLGQLEVLIGSGQVQHALPLANKAIQCASRNGDSSSLKEALFARAQLHFNLGQYEFCIEDCNEATAMVLHLEKESEMVEELRTKAWTHVSSHAMSRQKPTVMFDEGDSALKKALRTLRHNYQNRKKQKHFAADDDPFVEVFGPLEEDRWQFPDRELERLEDLQFHPSKVLCGLKNALVGEVLNMNLEPKNKALVAEQNIKTSDVFLIQNPVCLAVNPEVLSQYCYHCLKPIIQLWACDHCTAANFCSYGCKVESTPMHERVCDIMGNLHTAMREAPETMPSVMTAANLLAAQGLEFWTNLWLRTNPSQMGWSGRPQPLTFSNLGRVGESELEVCKKLDALFAASDNQFWKLPHKVAADLMIQCLFVVLCLKKAEFFFTYSEQTVIYSAGLLLRFSCMIMAHGVNIFATDTEKGRRPVAVGRALYAAMPSMTNSCDPNAIGYMISPSAMAWRALRPIRIGERITIAREAVFALESLSLRQEKLAKRLIKCTCKPCLRNWPTREQRTSKEVFHCPYCVRPIAEGTLLDLFKSPTTCKECKTDLAENFRDLRCGLSAMKFLASDDPPPVPEPSVEKPADDPKVEVIERKMKEITVGEGENPITCTVQDEQSQEASAGGDQTEESKVKKLPEDVMYNRANYPDVNTFKFASTFGERLEDPSRRLIKRPDLEKRIDPLKKVLPNPVKVVALYADSLAEFCDENSYRLAEAKEFLGTVMATAGKVFQEPYDGSM